jgi:hypothetical protein
MRGGGTAARLSRQAHRDNQLPVLLAELLLLAEHLQRHPDAGRGQGDTDRQPHRPQLVAFGVENHDEQHPGHQRKERPQHGNNGGPQPDLPQHREVHVETALEDHERDLHAAAHAARSARS